MLVKISWMTIIKLMLIRKMIKVDSWMFWVRMTKNKKRKKKNNLKRIKIEDKT
jgi:hypothetical protein